MSDFRYSIVPFAENKTVEQDQQQTQQSEQQPQQHTPTTAMSDPDATPVATAGLPKDVDPAQLNERDTRFLLFAVQSMRGGEQPMDYPRLAAAAGMTVSTANKAWSRLRKKLDLNFNGAAPGDSPGKGRKRKAATQLVKGEDDEDDKGAVKDESDVKAEDASDGDNAAAAKDVKDEAASDDAKECPAAPKPNKKAKTARAPRAKKGKAAKVAKEEASSDDDKNGAQEQDQNGEDAQGVQDDGVAV